VPRSYFAPNLRRSTSRSPLEDYSHSSSLSKYDSSRRRATQFLTELLESRVVHIFRKYVKFVQSRTRVCPTLRKYRYGIYYLTASINYTTIMLFSYTRLRENRSRKPSPQIQHSRNTRQYVNEGLRESYDVDYGESGQSLCSNHHDYCLLNQTEREERILRVIICFLCVSSRNHLIPLQFLSTFHADSIGIDRTLQYFHEWTWTCFR